MMLSLRRLVLAVLLTAPVLAAARQTAVPPPETFAGGDMIDRIFRAEEFAQRPAPAPQWQDKGESYIAIEPASDASGGANVALYDSATGAKREVLLTPGQLTPEGADRPLDVAGLSWSKDRRRVLLFTNTRRVWRTNSRGDYWLIDRAAGRLRKIGGDAPPASLMYAKLDPGATRVAYVRQNDIYVEELAGGTITRLTHDGSDLVINGGSDWVNEEELDLHDCFDWSPDGRRIAFWQFDTHGVGTFPLMYYLGKDREIVTHVPYPATGPYPFVMSVPYPIAGTTNSAVRVGVVESTGAAVKWMQVPGDAREHYIARLQWADGRTLLIQQLNRLQNTDDFLLADADTGAVRRMWRDRDEAFITIGFGGLPAARPIRDGAEFLALSEKNGWMHVYRVGRDGRETLLTRGDMDAMTIAGIDEKAGWLYFIASPENATQRYLYRAPLDGRSDPRRVTPSEFTGTNSYTISPDGSHAFHTFSRFDDPGISELVTLPDHKLVRVVDDNRALKRKLAALTMTPPVEYLKANAGGGVIVDGYMLKPPGFDASKRYPVLVHIYGEPAAQTVADRWGGSAGLYHRYVASLGYLVVSFDNAGTPAPRGRAWRKAVYGAVGVLSSKQQSEALRWLGAARPYVDLDRIAVWGWSGGGTNTLNLVFRSPELYRVGMSVAPVPDQRLYDTIYQERYMGLPQENADGYKQASAINFAEGLNGDLLIVHGSGDDNVHYQGTELLVNRLIELGKRFDFMTYPDRTHAIAEGPGTTSHLYHLLTRYLTGHLPAGPRDARTAAAALPAPTGPHVVGTTEWHVTDAGRARRVWEHRPRTRR
jgi:dipeptidyl-peptidase 4